jgi:hypothetical protein
VLTIAARNRPTSCEFGLSWRNIAISNNVGSVKHFLSALRHALEEERHFALVGGLRISNLGSLFIVGVRNSVRPSHLFDHPLRS